MCNEPLIFLIYKSFYRKLCFTLRKKLFIATLTTNAFFFFVRVFAVFGITTNKHTENTYKTNNKVTNSSDNSVSTAGDDLSQWHFTDSGGFCE